jgi:phosphoadenosine phosphosulfate reductase
MLWQNERAALQFSGGKDSLALLYLARPHLKRITVYFAETGAVFPHVRQHVEETCRRLGATLKIVLPPRHVAVHVDQVGLPSDIVPVEATLEMRPYLRSPAPQLLQSYMRCCGAMIFDPLEQAMRRDGHTIVLRGSKRGDRRAGADASHWEKGIEYRSPLWNWSDERVMGFLAEQGATLPRHYAAVPDSLDCWLCTAHLAPHGEAKLRWIRENHPELWPDVQDRFRRLNAALAREREKIAEALEFPENSDADHQHAAT